MSARRSVWLVTYEGTDVTAEIGSSVVSVEYTDSLKESDELQLTLEDRAGRWRAGWFPSEGDRIAVQFGWQGEPLLDAGQFRVDEVEITGSVVTTRALAVPSSDELRTPKSTYYEETSLAAMLNQVATALDLTIVGEPPDVSILRSTQANETVLAFVRRLAREWGYSFSIRGDQLVFFELAKLEAADPVGAVTLRDLIARPRMKAKTQETYVACEVRWFDPFDKALRRVVVYADHARERVILGGQDEGLSLNATEPPSIPSRLLRLGVRGEDVRQWQAWLSGQGHEPGPIDGIFGSKTRAATMRFQRTASVDVDGVAGPETFRAAVDAGYGVTRTSGAGTRTEVSGRWLRKEIRVETVEQAEIMARSLLAEANRLRASGALSLIGRPSMLAGTTVQVDMPDRLRGKYMVQQSKHRASRAGYTTEIEVSCV